MDEEIFTPFPPYGYPFFIDRIVCCYSALHRRFGLFIISLGDKLHVR